MEIQYYGVKGAIIDECFNSPDYYISKIIEHENKLLEKPILKEKTSNDYISVTPYANGVIYNFTKIPVTLEKDKNMTRASLIQTEEQIAFIVTSTAGPLEGYSSEDIERRIKENIYIGRNIISSLNRKIDIDKLKYKERSENKFIKKLEDKKEKKQREQYGVIMKKSIETLKQIQSKVEEDNIDEINKENSINLNKRGKARKRIRIKSKMR